MIITSAEKQKNNSDMIRIYLDNTYAFSMPEEEYIKMNLYERKELSQKEIIKIREEINISRAKQRGIRLLATRDRTEYEIRERLERYGFDKEAVVGAVQQIKAMGYINDRLFAHKYISDRLKLKPKSKKVLFYELHKKGVHTDLITEVLDEFELDESDIACRITKKKFGKYDTKDPQIQKKIISFLAHRGFSYDLIREVIKRISE